ncbi:peroxiredoxin [Spongiivirga sp. MCCC 1A20706]|uniref:peroxiredoxin n=1 Tax=Spongiivirga sp. MCCC 1A20706 TaxID=3160963 RepID=UPI003977AE5D
MGLQLGDNISDFKSIDQNGTIFKSEDYIGKNILVIYFYPKDNTPGCTKEACDFRDEYQLFEELGAKVVGVSGDSVASHKKFAKRHKLPFTLLADKNRKLRRLFGVETNLFGLLPGRETFVIDKSGKIVMRFNSMNAKNHMKKALKKVEEIAKS